MLNVERLGVVLAPRKNSTNEKLVLGRTSEFSVYNAGCVLDGDVVRMLYRSSRNRTEKEFNAIQGKKGIYSEDYIGYAELTKDGKLICDHGKVLAPSNKWDYSGLQDPRVIPFEGKYYITYCAYNVDIASDENPEKARLGFAVTEDFETFTKLGEIDLPQWDKDHFIFPERINGKVCLVHRIEPDIYMDFFDSIEEMLNPESWAKYHRGEGDQAIHLQRKYDWESLKIGGSLPPIKTDEGWLFVYHGVSWINGEVGRYCYCAGCALLDLNDPTKVLARLPEPILRPEADYEVKGDVDNVVFPVGGYISDGYLYISYGGADKVVAMARVKMDELMAELNKNRI